MVDQAETPLHHLILQVEKAVTSSQIHAVIADIRNYARMDALFQLYQPYRLSRSGLSPCFFDGRKPSSSGIYKCNGNKNVADLALRHQVEKFVMVSTDRAVNPTSVMEPVSARKNTYTQCFIARKVEETKQLNLLRLV
jgi:FlaA1/EpsC-like NDP-sugar epimerase